MFREVFGLCVTPCLAPVLATLVLVASIGCASSSPSPSTSPPGFPADPLTSVAGEMGATTIDVRTPPMQPPTRGLVDVELVVRDRKGAPLDGLTIHVVPWMSAHGHGASTTPTVVSEGKGRYWVRDVDLFMPGEWDLRVEVSGTVNDRADAKLEVR